MIVTIGKSAEKQPPAVPVVVKSVDAYAALTLIQKNQMECNRLFGQPQIINGLDNKYWVSLPLFLLSLSYT